MQQRLIDDTVEDSFPASDPPAWTTSGSKSVAAECDPDEVTQDSAAATAPPEARERISRAVAGAAQLAQDTYRAGRRVIDEGRRRSADVEHYDSEGRQALAARVQNFPLAAVLAAGVIGYALALLIHGRPQKPSLRRGLRPYGSRPAYAAKRQAVHRHVQERIGEFRRRAEEPGGTNDSY